MLQRLDARSVLTVRWTRHKCRNDERTQTSEGRADCPCRDLPRRRHGGLSQAWPLLIRDPTPAVLGAKIKIKNIFPSDPGWNRPKTPDLLRNMTVRTLHRESPRGRGDQGRNKSCHAIQLGYVCKPIPIPCNGKRPSVANIKTNEPSKRVFSEG